jgi:TRAP-type C4-dicarboxylate transport system permease small subunit
LKAVVKTLTAAENLLATLALAGIMLLPLAEIATRLLFHRGIPGAGPFTLNLTIWVALLGAAVGAREGKLLTLATGEFLPRGTINFAHVVSGFAGAAIAMTFAVGGLAFVLSEREARTIVAVDVPVWVAALVFPIAFTLIALRLAWKSSPHWWGRAISPQASSPACMRPGTSSCSRAHRWSPGCSASSVAGSARHTDFLRCLAASPMVAFFIDGTRPIVPLNQSLRRADLPGGNLAAIPLFTLPDSSWRRASPPLVCCARCARCLVGPPGGTRWRRPRCVLSLHFSRADQASRSSRSAACCCRRS